MRKTLSAVGNSLGLIIERPILDLLKINRDTPLEIETDGNALIITPVRATQAERVSDITEELMNRHDKVLRELSNDAKCPDGVLITAQKSEVSEQLQLARTIMEKRRDALHKLSK